MSTLTTAIAIRDDQVTFDDLQVKALAQLGVDRAEKADLAIFFHQCKRTGLDPFLRQIHMIGRRTKVNNQWVTKQTIQTGIDGFRLIARRAADRRKESLGYSDPLWCGEDGLWREVWLATEPPAGAKIVVHRNGQPFPGVAVFREFCQRKSDGTLNSQWSSKPAHMIAKCAEALALRMAFPQDLSGLYTDDETGIEAPEPGAPSQASGGTRRMSRAAHEAGASEPEPVDAEIVTDDDPVNEPTEDDIEAMNAEAAEQAAEAVAEPEPPGLFQ
jgi:phage recombination protein Bet